MCDAIVHDQCIPSVRADARRLMCRTIIAGGGCGGAGGAHLDVDVRVGHGRRWRGARTLDWGMEGRDAGREL